jgi:hypothetical protein
VRGGRLGDVGIAAAVAGEEIDELGNDRASAPDAVLLHEDGKDVALLVEIGELLAESEKPLVLYRTDEQTDAVDLGRPGPARADDEA